jgi:hypothetical protein
LLLRRYGPLLLALTTSTGQLRTDLTSFIANEPVAGRGSSRVPAAAHRQQGILTAC